MGLLCVVGLDEKYTCNPNGKNVWGGTPSLGLSYFPITVVPALLPFPNFGEKNLRKVRRESA